MKLSWVAAVGLSGLYCEILELWSAWSEHFEGQSQWWRIFLLQKILKLRWQSRGQLAKVVDGSPGPGEAEPGLQLGHKQLLHCSGVEALSPA